ncbi:MAG: MerC domain-containing protein [Gammaproteobacteria bacterium]|nr:MerC domain-containing protein [Gammaproteobacteria bacterium]
MNNTQRISDKAAISLSLLCTVHCLALPLIAVFLPSIAVLPLADEAFHLWLLVAVVPVSAYALTLGCKKHQRYRVVATGVIGLSTLVAAALFGHDMLGETGEKALTVVGTIIIAFGHIWNYRLCKSKDNCGCSEQH